MGRKSAVGCVSMGEVGLGGWGAVVAQAVVPVQLSRAFQHLLHVRPVTDTCGGIYQGAQGLPGLCCPPTATLSFLSAVFTLWLGREGSRGHPYTISTVISASVTALPPPHSILDLRDPIHS